MQQNGYANVAFTVLPSNLFFVLLLLELDVDDYVNI